MIMPPSVVQVTPMGVITPPVRIAVLVMFSQIILWLPDLMY